MSKQIFTILFFFFLSIGQLISQTPVTIKKSEEIKIINSKEYYIHHVEKSQTLYSISKVYEVSVDEIKFENPSSKNGLSIGQELKIPVKSRDAIVRESYSKGNYDFFYHIVKNGEDLKRIASLYSVTFDHLKSSNNNLSEPLKPGQYVKIPIMAKVEPNADTITQKPVSDKISPEKPKDQYITYITKPGDNLYRIAIKYQVSIDEIKNINPGLQENFYVGKEIRIPQKKNKLNYINHRVVKRERLSNIAKYYNVSYLSVLQINPRIKTRVQVGQIVKIPVAHKEVEEEVKEVAVHEPQMLETTVNPDSLKCFSNESNLSKTYQVALLIPLYLEEVDSLKFDPDHPQVQILDKKSFEFMGFYYGVLSAIDSLKKQGLKIDLYVFDVDDDVSKAIKVINYDEMRKMDLIIGPFYTAVFPTVAAFAKNYNISIINPLSNRSEILSNNQTVFKFQPTDRYQIEDIKKLVGDHYKNSKLFLIDQRPVFMNDPLTKYANELSKIVKSDFKIPDLDIYNLAIEKAAADTSLEAGEVQQMMRIEGKNILTYEMESHLEDSTCIANEIILTHFEQDSLNLFKDNASVFRNNAVIINTDDNVFALNVLTELNILRDTFPTVVIGLPNWAIFNNMDNEIYKNLNVHYLSPTYIDYNDLDVKSFIRGYRNKFLSEPENYAFIGFDISWYFLNALMKFGTDFEDCLQYYHPKLIQSGISFERNNRKDGYENTQWQVIRFHNYELQKVKLLPLPN